MTQSDLPIWTQYAQALGPPALAIVGAALAWQQVRISRVKLQHDLYERRFAIFDAARVFLSELLRSSTGISNEQIRSFFIRTSDSRFILNDEIYDYLSVIRRRAIRLQTINEALTNLPIGDKRAEIAKEDEEISEWLGDQFKVLINIFRPFLTLEKISLLSRVKRIIS
jgi:hypothetical protein